mgnify:FL=1
MTRGGSTYYYTFDGLGSVRDLTDSGEAVAEQYDYDSFGNLTAPPATGNPYTYTSREYDPETGLLFYRARYYDPATGRFLTADPIGFDGGDVNFYAYTRNNPIDRIDPLGLYWGESQINWWAYESALPGPYGQPVSEWKCGSPTGWGDPMKYTEEAGGAWMWWERGAVGAAAGLTFGAIGYESALPYWRYVGPNSNPASRWLTRGWKPPYGNNFKAARDALQIRDPINAVERVKVPWWRPVAGPRPVQDPTGTYGNPDWGSGSGSEWYRGIRFP